MSGKKNIKIMVYLVLVFAALPFFAQTPEESWTRLAVSYSGNITALAVSPSYETDQTLYIGVKDSGLWKSTDRGVTWTQCPAVPCEYTVSGIGLGKDYCYGSGDPCFVVTEDTYYFRSDDDFQTYSYAYQFMIGSMMVYPAILTGVVVGGVTGFDNAVYVGTFGGGVYAHYSGGNSDIGWTSLGPYGFKCRSLTLTSNSTQVLWLAGSSSAGVGGVHRYVGGGVGWVSHEADVGSLEMLSIRASWTNAARLWAGGASTGIWYSFDSGDNWSAGCEAGSAPYQVRSIRECPVSTHGSELWEGTSKGMRFSTNSGTSLCSDIFPGSGINCVEFAPAFHGTGDYCEMFVGTESALYRIPCEGTAKVRSPIVVDGHSVALAKDGLGVFMGSMSQGLFKSLDTTSTGGKMVRYNSFPNGETPEIAAVCPHPHYADDDGGCGTEETLFAAANFPVNSGDNGVYKSVDAGNSWVKVNNASTWPTSTINLNDLEISPNYGSAASPATAGNDGTLFAATSLGVFRWSYDVKDGRYEWANVSSSYFSQAAWVKVTPTFDSTSSCSFVCNGTSYSGFPCKTVWSYGYDFNNTRYCLFYSRNLGDTWTPVYPTASPALCPTGTTCPTDITGITFPSNYMTGATPSTKLYVSSSSKGVLAGQLTSTDCLYTAAANWATKNGWLPMTKTVVDIASDPDWVDPTEDADDVLICALSNSGVWRTSNASNTTPTWSRIIQGHALSVGFESRKWGASHQMAMAGFAKDEDMMTNPPYGAYYTANIADLTTYPFHQLTGYYSLPDDVFSSVVHERDPDYVFASSPSMGVFVSTDKGENFNPYNLGAGGSLGPCRLDNGYGITMLADRAGSGSGIDVLYVGTDNGIKARHIYYDGSSIHLDWADGAGGPSSWLDTSWYGGGDTTGYWERLEVAPETADTMPVWAVSPDKGALTGQGFASLPSGQTDGWILQTGGLGSTNAKGVRTGQDGGSTTAYQLQSGQTVTGSVRPGIWNYYHVDMTIANQDLQVLLSDPDGTQSGGQNCGLYLRYNNLPTASTYDYRITSDGDKTVCVTEIVLENFSSSWGPYGDSPPAGWTIETNETAPVYWDDNNWYNYSSSPRVYSTFGRLNEDEKIISPLFDIPSTFTSANVSFRHRFYMTSSGANIYVRFRSSENPSWITLYSRNYEVSETRTLDLSSYIGNTDCQLMFEYSDPSMATGTRYWSFDDVQVYGASPPSLRPGEWNIGILGIGSGDNGYLLTPLKDSGCTQSFGNKAERTTFIPPDPRAPVGTATWGTVNGSGVYKGTGTISLTESGHEPSAITWLLRNGTTYPLANVNANTIIQLPDLTLIVGCDASGSSDKGIFYSPSPDEGATTWTESSAVAGEGSKNYIDLLAASNGDVLIAGDDSGSADGGVWLTGDKGKNWMRISQGFDSSSQALSDLVADNGDPVSYYASTAGTGDAGTESPTGLWTRTITASQYPTITSIVPDNGGASGGTAVTITGTGFSDLCPTGHDDDCPDASPVVIFGDTEVAATYISSTTLTAVTPPHDAEHVLVKIRNRDTRQSMAGVIYTFVTTCQPPSGLPNNTAVDADPCADTGVLVSWSDPADWGDGGSGARSFDVLRDGSAIQAGLSSSTHEYTDTTGTNGVTYAYSARANNGCGMSAVTPGASAADILCVPPEVGPGDSESNAQDWTEDKATQTWPAAERATGYHLYKFALADLPYLQNTSDEGCKWSVGNVTSHDCSGDDPSVETGRVYFYLVTGVNETGEGTGGDGTGFTRALSTSITCSP
ncbi:MAG TPA: IPT/TIG domain-containing protein [Acidobacteriota bacterium]|nr:IPT/TIG domain-containing protein [Acidobacteriota bacterium]HNT16852.1 IPT/TIG domain-containing protein [Acidobacteriota bacterium]